MIYVIEEFGTRKT